MGLKKIIITLNIIYLCFPCFASTQEEQRKYKFLQILKDADIAKLIEKPIAEFKLVFHSKYTSWDIYFDDADEDMKNRGFSFRLRRVKKNLDSFEYALQLKNEMEVSGQKRLEVEYKDFSLQYINHTKITDLINVYFDGSHSVRESLNIQISTWLTQKMNSTLPPFQKLRDLKLNNKKFSPRITVISDRRRYHVVIDREKTKNEFALLKDSAKNIKFSDDLLKQNPNWVWLFEASLDTSSLALTSSPKDIYKISEIEVENKYRPRKKGTKLLNLFEDEILKSWNLKTETHSKYRQALEKLEVTK